MLERHLGPALEAALRFFPVVLIRGARQVGKSTLARMLCGGRWKAEYFTLDDPTHRDAALRDPDLFLAAQATVPSVIDEVQRAPDLMRAVKRIVDENRRPGMYLLTGSADVLTLKKVSESLAGRIGIFNLEPFSWNELSRRTPNKALEILLTSVDSKKALKSLGLKSGTNRIREIRRLVLRGGYPTPALARKESDRQAWLRSYVETYVERDVRNLVSLEYVPEFRRLLSLLALRTGRLLNYTDLSRDLGLNLMTIRRYCDLLDVTYQIFLVPPFFANYGKRLVKTPKLFLTDPGIACYLSGAESWELLERQGRTGALVETWVACELRRILSRRPDRVSLWFWRTQDGHEVDFVLESRSGKVMGLEVKMGSSISKQDLDGLNHMRTALKDRMGMGIVAYGGTRIVPLDAKTIAVPFGVLFGPDGPAAKPS